MRNSDLSDRARMALPGGVSHELRYRDPHPVFIERAKGAEKWDVEGRRYLDFKMGSASQMLGHGHPAVIEALERQAGQAIFSADCHAAEILWAEWVKPACSIRRAHPLHRFGHRGDNAGAAAGAGVFGQGPRAANRWPFPRVA